MNSMDGVNQASNSSSELRPNSVPGAKKPAKTAEEYVMIENRLAAQREKPTASPQFTSIFDQLRDRLPR